MPARAPLSSMDTLPVVGVAWPEEHDALEHMLKVLAVGIHIQRLRGPADRAASPSKRRAAPRGPPAHVGVAVAVLRSAPSDSAASASA